MRHVFGLVIAAGIVLGLTSSASAQINGLGFGGYPAGITTGSSYGFYPGGYNGPYSSATTGYMVRPGGGVSTYYSSGFYGGVPGTTTYGPGVNYSASSAYPYGTYGYSSSYGNYRVQPRGPIRRMFGGWRYR